MKKGFICGMILVIALLGQIPSVSANEYLSYQEIVFDSDDAVLLREYTEADMNRFYEQFDQRIFLGWKVFSLHHQEHLEFVAETKLKIVNNGYSTIKHTIAMSSKEESKFQITASGDIGLDLKGDIHKFKGHIDVTIKTTVQYTKSVTKTESCDFVIIVDPGTTVSIRSRGEGIINNGIAKYYLFWINTKKGGWETFILTTEYYEIVKEKIV